MSVENIGVEIRSLWKIEATCTEECCLGEGAVFSVASLGVTVRHFRFYSLNNNIYICPRLFMFSMPDIRRHQR